MAASALQKIDEREHARKRRQRTIIRTAVPVFCLCIAALFGIGVWRSVTPQGTSAVQPDSSTDKGNAGTIIPDDSDVIVINKLESITADRMNIALLDEDFVKMSASELNEYYGINVFPVVPSDLVNWDNAEDFGGYGIYRREKGGGEIYFDQNVLNYSNPDYTRNVNIEVSKDRLPFLDFSIDPDELAGSTISGNSVYLGCNDAGYYQARFIYRSTGFVLTTYGLSQDEYVSVVQSIINDTD